jgi:hypothetical protein
VEHYFTGVCRDPIFELRQLAADQGNIFAEAGPLLFPAEVFPEISLFFKNNSFG